MAWYSRRMLVRALLLILFPLYAGVVLWSFHAAWLLEHPTPENLTRGTPWHSRNPQFWSMLAWSLLHEHPDKANDAFLRAASLNPLDVKNWEGSALACLQLGEMRQAEAAWRGQLAAMPHSPTGAWQLANILLLTGRAKEAIPYLRTAAGSDSALRLAAFDTGWKILDSPEEILRDVVPADAASRKQYLDYLIGKRKLTPATERLGVGPPGTPRFMARLRLHLHRCAGGLRNGGSGRPRVE